MFVLRLLFWLTALTMFLPPSAEGGPPPRVSLVHAAHSGRILLQDLTGVCIRNPDACAASRDALALFARKLETGAGIMSAGLSAGQGFSIGSRERGTLRASDLEPAWTLADSRL